MLAKWSEKRLVCAKRVAVLSSRSVNPDKNATKAGFMSAFLLLGLLVWPEGIKIQAPKIREFNAVFVPPAGGTDPC